MFLNKSYAPSGFFKILLEPLEYGRKIKCITVRVIVEFLAILHKSQNGIIQLRIQPIRNIRLIAQDRTSQRRTNNCEMNTRVREFLPQYLILNIVKTDFLS